MSPAVTEVTENVVFAVLAVNGPLPLPLASTTAIADVGPNTVLPPVHVVVHAEPQVPPHCDWPAQLVVQLVPQLTLQSFLAVQPKLTLLGGVPMLPSVPAGPSEHVAEDEHVQASAVHEHAPVHSRGAVEAPEQAEKRRAATRRAGAVRIGMRRVGAMPVPPLPSAHGQVPIEWQLTPWEWTQQIWSAAHAVHFSQSAAVQPLHATSPQHMVAPAGGDDGHPAWPASIAASVFASAGAVASPPSV